MSGPFCTILAGPNGSGKSSIYEQLLPPGEFVNADVIEVSLPPSLSAAAKKVRAGRLVVAKINKLIIARQSFTFETTLSSRHSLRVMELAREAGFEVGLVFVALDDAERNIDRIKYRVKLGGHDIPRSDVIRRYDASFANLPAAIELSNEAVLIDNSMKKPVWVCTIANGRFIRSRMMASSFGNPSPTAFQTELMLIGQKAARGPISIGKTRPPLNS